jgi:hypothetical protein
MGAPLVPFGSILGYAHMLSMMPPARGGWTCDGKREINRIRACETEFFPKRTTARYCSTACRMSAHRTPAQERPVTVRQVAWVPEITDEAIATGRSTYNASIPLPGVGAMM